MDVSHPPRYRLNFWLPVRLEGNVLKAINEDGSTRPVAQTDLWPIEEQPVREMQRRWVDKYGGRRSE